MSDLKLETVEQKASYGIGCQMGQQLAGSGLEGLSVEAIAAGIGDMLAGKAFRLSTDELESAMTALSKSVAEKQAIKAREQASEGDKFLADNAKRDAIIVLESGLQYEIISSGDGGEKPTANSQVRTHYHGTFINGDVFDSSYERGSPAQFPVNGVIKGWTEALQLMTRGDKWRLYVPFSLAYGEKGAPGAIPPFSTLIFDVELLEIIN